jgi:hypothetical protein
MLGEIFLRGRRVEPEQALEQVFDGFASALEYFACPLHGTNSDVLASFCSAFAQVGRGIDGMKRHQVSGGFACSLGSAASTFRCALADISGATADVMFSAGVDADRNVTGFLHRIRCLRDTDIDEAHYCYE